MILSIKIILRSICQILCLIFQQGICITYLTLLLEVFDFLFYLIAINSNNNDEVIFYISLKLKLY